MSTRWRAAHQRWHAAQHRVGHSLRWRLVLLFLLMGAATTAVFVVGTQRVVQGGWEAFARPLLSDYVDRLTAELGTPPDPARARALAERLPLRVRIEGPQVQFDSRPQTPNFRSYENDREPTRLAATLTRRTADGHTVHFSLGQPSQTWRARGVGWMTLGGLLLLTALAYLAVRRLLAPLTPIGQGVERFGRGEFTPPIAVRQRGELGDLATRINAMAGSLHGMLEAKRGLLLAISHELRSPLTRARLNAELLDETPERQALMRDLGEMRDLITTLLESERLAQGHAALQREPTDLAALARDLVATQFEGRSVTLSLDEGLGATAVDPMRLRLLLRNLLDNALRHAADAATPPELFLRPEADGRWALGVRDHGPGLAPDQLQRLCEPFHRPDSARSRDVGGVGLGLHLCRLVAQAHEGELRIRPMTPGLEVSMCWRPRGRAA